MDHFQGITAEIISNGQVLKLYDDPDAAENEDSDAHHHYVEAVAGSTFKVNVHLTPQFKLNKMKAEHAVKIRVGIDGGHDSALSSYLTKASLQERFTRGRPYDGTFTGVRQFCKETGQWMMCDYSFGDLVLKETPDPGLSVKKAQQLGTIQVTVQRVRREKLQVPRVPSKKPIATMTEVPEKALKGRPIDTTVRLTNARPTVGPSIHTMTSKCIDGEAGKPAVFNIHYRSRRALQMLGCIPRSPSPEVQISTHKATVPADVTQEVRDLRARLALLERGLDAKSESSRAATRVKREREEESKEGSSQKRRTSVKIEHVDLTGD